MERRWSGVARKEHNSGAPFQSERQGHLVLDQDHGDGAALVFDLDTGRRENGRWHAARGRGGAAALGLGLGFGRTFLIQLSTFSNESRSMVLKPTTHASASVEGVGGGVGGRSGRCGAARGKEENKRALATQSMAYRGNTPA